MIPRSITLRGFLCYRDEQVIDLDGCDLWVLAGRNGSGKSAIFDAMTFALFGTHRGGQHSAARLIHEEANSLRVVFEFDLGGDRYRIERSVPRKGQATRIVYRCEPGPDGQAEWPAVPETQRDDGFKAWVRNHVGLSYETFTASVLLLQGQSDKLLLAGPKDRFDILAGIVDLESYRRLHTLAEQRRRDRKGHAERLRAQLQRIEVIEPEVIERAEAALADAEAARLAADVECNRLAELRGQATHWPDLVKRREKAAASIERARRLIADAEAIARDRDRLGALEEALPVARESLRRRGEIARWEAQERDGREEQATARRKLDLIQHLDDDNRAHLGAIVEEIERDEARVRAILERQTALAAPIERLKRSRELRAQVRRLEATLAEHPEGLAERFAKLEEAYRLRDGWSRALPWLAQLAAERDRLVEARRRGREAAAAHAAAAAEAGRSATARDARRAEESAAGEAREQACRRAAVANDRLRDIEKRIADFEGLEGLAACDRCGQPLTPAHAEAERTRLRDERRRAADEVRDARRVAEAAGDVARTAEAALADAERALKAAESACEDARRDRDEAGRTADLHARACSAAFDQLDAPFRARVAAAPPDDWAATTFPAPTDLESAHQFAADAEAARSGWEDTREQLVRRDRDQALLKQAQQGLASLGLESGDDGAEAEYSRLDSERTSLALCLDGHCAERACAEANRDGLDERARTFRERLAVAERKIGDARARLDGLRDESTRALAAAPDGWRAAIEVASRADIDRWEGEVLRLRDQGTTERVAELARANETLQEAEAELADLARAVDALPEDARRDPESFAPRIAEAERGRRQADALRQDRHAELDRLRRAEQEHKRLTDESLDAERGHAVAATLADLLGPRGLQRDLIREAERGIVAFADRTLREVSCGELELRLVEAEGGEPDHALQLEAVERVQGRVGERPVEYLSGSQRFRVAVSLALGIGQYARGGQGRPIESVIIDEGFGALDRQGRDEMIAQLNTLRGRLARIVLVSHQEEFAEAFRDGYQLVVENGSTVARPFHR